MSTFQLIPAESVVIALNIIHHLEEGGEVQLEAKANGLLTFDA